MLPNRKRRLGREVAVVLGAGLHQNGTPSQRTAIRARTAAELAKTHPGMTFILSGCGPNYADPAATTEAWQMALILKQAGIPWGRLLLEDESRDTVGNAILVYARYLRRCKPRKLYLVTSPFHMERAFVAFRAVLGPDWEIQMVPTGTADGDDVKLTNEAGGVDWMKRFFDGFKPGDIPGLLARVRTKGKPYFQDIAWLQRLDRRAA